MVIENQFFSVNYVNPNQDNLEGSLENQLVTTFPLHHYHQDDLVLKNYLTPTMRKPTPQTNKTKSFFIDDLLGINETTTIDKKNHQSKHNNNTTDNINSNPVSISSSSTFPSPFKKRSRTTFTKEQLEILEKIFSHTQYMAGVQRSALSKSLGLSDYQVRVWFQNRRIKERKTMEMMLRSHDESSKPMMEIKKVKISLGGKFYLPEKQFKQLSKLNQSI